MEGQSRPAVAERWYKHDGHRPTHQVASTMATTSRSTLARPSSRAMTIIRQVTYRQPGRVTRPLLRLWNCLICWTLIVPALLQTKDGSPAEEGHYKANIDVMMAIDAVELSVEMKPDVIILVTGDADFAYLAIKLRRHGIRVEVASVAANLGNTLRSAANDVIDLAPLFRSFEMMKIQDSPAPAGPQQQQQPRQHRTRPRFRPSPHRNP